MKTCSVRGICVCAATFSGAKAAAIKIAGAQSAARIRAAVKTRVTTTSKQKGIGWTVAGTAARTVARSANCLSPANYYKAQEGLGFSASGRRCSCLAREQSGMYLSTGDFEWASK